MSKTLELPDDLAALIDGPEAEAMAIEAIRERFADEKTDFDDTIAGIRRGVADIEAGRHLPEVEARIQIRATIQERWANRPTAQAVSVETMPQATPAQSPAKTQTAA